MRFSLYIIILSQVTVLIADKTIGKEVITGTNATLECPWTRSLNYPVWTRHNDILVTDNRIISNGSQTNRLKVQNITEDQYNLVITDTTENDTGCYCCFTIYENKPKRFCTQLEIVGSDIYDSTIKNSQVTFEQERNKDDSTIKNSQVTFEQERNKDDSTIKNSQVTFEQERNKDDSTAKNSQTTFEQERNKDDSTAKNSQTTFEQERNKDDSTAKNSQTTFEQERNKDDSTVKNSQVTFEQERNKDDNFKRQIIGISIGVFIVNLLAICICCIILLHKRRNSHSISAAGDTNTDREMHEFPHVYHTIQDEDIFENRDNTSISEINNSSSIIYSDESEQNRNTDDTLERNVTPVENHDAARSYTSLVGVLPDNFHEYEKLEKNILPEIHMSANGDQIRSLSDLTDNTSNRNLGRTISETCIQAVSNLGYDLVGKPESNENSDTTAKPSQLAESIFKNENNLDMSVSDTYKDLAVDDISLD